MSSFAKTLRGWLVGPIPLSIMLAFLIGAGFIALAGYSPITGYNAMLQGSLLTPLGVTNTLQRAVPLIGMALATSVAFRAGVLNIGTEGQMVIGGLCGALVALHVPGPWFVVIPLALLGAGLGGALWALLSGVLQLRPGVPILITSLLLSYPARYLASWMVRFPLKDPQSSQVATRAIPESAQISMLVPAGSTVHGALVQTFGSKSFITSVLSSTNWGVVIVLALVIVIAFVNTRTSFGYDSGINGMNSRFTVYGGVNSTRVLLTTMALSGAISGVIGAIVVIGAPSTRYIDGAIIATNYAFTGLLVALLALYRPWFVVVAGLFFGSIIAGSGQMSRELGMSPQIASVVQGILIVLIAFEVSWPHFRRKQDRAVEASTVPTDEKDKNHG